MDRCAGTSLRAVVGLVLSAWSLTALPIVAQASKPSADAIPDSIQKLNRTGNWVSAEEYARRSLVSQRPLSHSARCGVLTGLAYASMRSGKADSAAAALRRFDTECKDAKADARESARQVRAELAGKGVQGGNAVSRSAIYDSASALNRTGHWAEAAQLTKAFLVNATWLKPAEACGALDAQAYAQYQLRHMTDARASLALFDSKCTGVAGVGAYTVDIERTRKAVGGRP